jgi:hypothetical protein
MTTLFGIGFASPWLLATLLTLPILWLLLRAIPPAPVRRAFPAVSLLLGLTDDEAVSDRTPWWLLLLRMLAVALIITGLAGPTLNPGEREDGQDRLLVLLDSSWAGARNHDAANEKLTAALTEAGRNGRAVAVMRLTAPQPPEFLSANVWRARVPGLLPAPWQPGETQVEMTLEHLGGIDGGFDTLWLSDGLDHPGRERLIEALRDRGALNVLQPEDPVLALRPGRFTDGLIEVTLLRAAPGGELTSTVVARGTDPGGAIRNLASVELRFAPQETMATGTMSLPAELRARITRFELLNSQDAGTVALTDDSLRRREVGLVTGRENREGLQLLSPLHYLRQALAPSAELLDGTVTDLVPANPDVIVLADIARLSGSETKALTSWIEQGGLLLRFAGPRLAASELSRQEEDPLMPVRLRSGGRSVGGAMSWGAPKSLASFTEASPFYGLGIPVDVSVTSQVVAQPDPSLAERVIAELSDGTPLVTRKTMGQGQVVLFHVTANAEWSNLPLSGLFVGMLERLAVSTTARLPEAGELEGTTWTPVQVLDGFGRLQEAGTLAGVSGPDLVSKAPGPDLRPGVYRSDRRKLARNVIGAEDVLVPASWPATVPVQGLATAPERPLGGILLSIALLLLSADIAAALALSGRLIPARAVVLLPLLVSLNPAEAPAQEQDRALTATSELVLAHVLTGNREVDQTANAGLMGLTDTLYFRTSVEPALPVGVDLERDELAFFPLLYWPVTPDQPQPSDAAYGRLNAYLRTGGMIIFDTRDANIAGFGAQSPNGRKLRQLAAPLDIPPLEPLPKDHVLTRTFYLLQDFPGRHAQGQVWVESAPPDAEQIEGMPFRNLNDGVTPVVIGGNDWAAAWAVDNSGRPLLPVGRGYAGAQQRELAYRFGVNLVMHVLTGNYKSDQVHVPALLDRLGQ